MMCSLISIKVYWVYLCRMKILMVCLGNICRSPLAEGILKDKAEKAGLDWFVDSAGTSNYHICEPPHKLSQKVAKLNGIDISKQMCRQFVKEDMLRFDKIYVMDNEVYDEIKSMSGSLWSKVKTDLLMNELYPGKNMDVPDPWFDAEPKYHEVFKMISEACDAIIGKFKNQNSKVKTELA